MRAECRAFGEGLARRPEMPFISNQTGVGAFPSPAKIRMQAVVKTVFTAFCLIFVSLLAPVVCSAFDGRTPLTGTVTRIVEVLPAGVNENVSPDSLGVPRTFVIDFSKRMIIPGPDSVVRRQARFASAVRTENRIILQGIDPGVEGVDDTMAWNMVIDVRDGGFALSATDGGRSFIAFGACSPGSEP